MKKALWHRRSSAVVFWMFSGEKSSQACVRSKTDPGARDWNFQEHRHCSANGNALRRPLHFRGEAGVCAACGGRTRYALKDYF